MPGWQMASSVFASPTDARFFAFNLTEHTFEWWRKNDSYSDTMDEDEVIIKDIADISNLLEFVYLNCEKLRDKDDLAKAFAKLFNSDPVANPPPKKKRKKDENTPHLINVAALKKKLDAMHPKPQFNAMNFIDQSMSVPSAKVMYSKWEAAGGKALPYDTTVKVKLGKIPKTSWGVKAEMTEWEAKSAKMHEEMAAELQKEIDEEILAKLMATYQTHLHEEAKQKSWFAYDKATKGKSWGGWANGMYDHVVVKSPPYNVVDSMDY